MIQDALFLTCGILSPASAYHLGLGCLSRGNLTGRRSRPTNSCRTPGAAPEIRFQKKANGASGHNVRWAVHMSYQGLLYEVL